MVGCGFGTEKFTLGSLGNMLIVGVGIAIASYGALPGTGRTAFGVADQKVLLMPAATVLYAQGS